MSEYDTVALLGSSVRDGEVPGKQDHVDGEHGRFLVDRSWWPRLDMSL